MAKNATLNSISEALALWADAFYWSTQLHHCSTGCGKFLDNIHIFDCVVLNQTHESNIEQLTNGTFEEMKLALNKWNNNLKKLEIINSMDSVNFC